MLPGIRSSGSARFAEQEGPEFDGPRLQRGTVAASEV